MAATPVSVDSRQLSGNLDRLTERARKVMAKAYLEIRGRQVLCRILVLLFLFVLPVLLLESIRYLAGYPSFGLSGWHYGLLVLACAGVFAAGRLLKDYLNLAFPRGKALDLFDSQLKLSNRLATADEFIGARRRTGFMQAAIEDAVEPAKRAMNSQVQPINVSRQWRLSRWSLASVSGTVALLLLTTWLGGLELANAGAEPGTAESGKSSPDLAVIANVAEESAGETGRHSGDEPLRLARSDADPGTAASADVPQSAAGRATANPAGRSVQQQGGNQSSASMQSSGVPSGSASRPQAAAASGQQSSRSGRQSAVGQQSRQSAAEQQGASGQRQAASETGSSNPSAESGSSDSTADSGQSGNDGQDNGTGAESPEAEAQGAQGEGEQGEAQDQPGTGQGEGDDREGESEQSSEGAGEGQRTAEGESQSSGESGGEPDARAQRQGQGEGGQPDTQGQGSEGTGEGRSSGEDAIKKNRGAAKAMLAVPTADRLIGQRGEGPEQTRQEQSPPLEEQVAPAPASARTQRGDRIGTLQHARISGWSRDLVMSYFDRPQDEAAGDTIESTNTNTGNGRGE